MNIRNEVHPDTCYVLDGRTMQALIKVMDRLYDDSKPLVVNERRDLAQRIHALLETACEL